MVNMNIDRNGILRILLGVCHWHRVRLVDETVEPNCQSETVDTSYTVQKLRPFFILCLILEAITEYIQL